MIYPHRYPEDTKKCVALACRERVEDFKMTGSGSEVPHVFMPADPVDPAVVNWGVLADR